MFKKNPVKTIRVRLYCDICGAEMQQDGFVCSTNPPRYPYTCPECGWKTTTNEFYPTIEFIDDNSN